MTGPSIVAHSRFELHDAAIVAALAAILLLPALISGFPLIFPDSGAYLSIGLVREYALDRSSFYGFFLKPMVTALGGANGLWLAIIVQCLLVAMILWPAARALCPRRIAIAVLLVICAVTSLAWHSAQFMPDAFTGPAVLLGWLLSRREPEGYRAVLLWLAAVGVALVHYTHLPVLLAAGAASLAAQKFAGLDWRSVWRRGAVVLLAVTVAALVQTAANLAFLSRVSPSPLGPLFLYARLNEDGLIAPWLKRHCGSDAPAYLCQLAPSLPTDSQALLWSMTTPINELVWHPKAETVRWKLIDAMALANRGAIGERPLAFAASSLRGAASQFVTFRALDDECPENCHRDTAIALALRRHRPAALDALSQSRQTRGALPKSLIRAVTTPVAALALIALPLLGIAAWRRRDRAALGLVAAILVSLIVNALLAGALSDVHDRYQSRMVWLAPFALTLLVARWWGQRRVRVAPVSQADSGGQR